jgi:hypothetical protein
MTYLYVESIDHGRDHKTIITNKLSDLHNKNIFMAAKKKAAKKVAKKAAKKSAKKATKKVAKKKSAKRA